MLEVKIGGMVMDAVSKIPGIVLHDMEEKRALLIWIGPAEAQSIMQGIQQVKAKRPTTHDLIHSILESVDNTLRSVLIDGVDNGTYLAHLTLIDRQEEIRTVDARPSDAIALAVRKGVPILVTEEVMAQASYLLGAEEEAVNEDEDQAFRQFLSSVRASDFQLPHHT